MTVEQSPGLRLRPFTLAGAQVKATPPDLEETRAPQRLAQAQARVAVALATNEPRHHTLRLGPFQQQGSSYPMSPCAMLTGAIIRGASRGGISSSTGRRVTQRSVFIHHSENGLPNGLGVATGSSLANTTSAPSSPSSSSTSEHPLLTIVPCRGVHPFRKHRTHPCSRRYQLDEAHFLAAYPEAAKGHTALLIVINAAREARGEHKVQAWRGCRSVSVSESSNS